jgi:hypothetical protein
VGALIYQPEPAVAQLARDGRIRQGVIFGGLLGTAAIIGPVVGTLVAMGYWEYALFTAALLVPVVMLRSRASTVIMLVVASTAFMRFPDPGADAITSRIPIFRSFTETFGVSGAVLLPIEVLFALALVLWIGDVVARRRLALRATHLGVAVWLFLGAAFYAEFLGLARGGVFNISLWELRPFVYLALSYLLAAQLLSSRPALQAVLWGIVVGTGSMAILGTERTINTLGAFPRPDALLEHDEAFFFGLFLLVTATLWVHGQRGWLRRVATALLPFVIVADFGNNRRAAWLIIPAMLAAMVAVAYVRMPLRRRTILIITASVCLVGAGYVLALHNSTGLVAEPAHGIWSQIRPDPRDYASNLYRQIENVNVGLDIKSAPLGEGFGVPLQHPIPVFNATGLDPLINFIPHNTILYVWLRMGMLGALAFWFLVGAAIVAACRLARLKDPWYGLYGTVVLCAVIGWLADGWLDKGIVSFRIEILVGCLLGGLQAAKKLSVAGRWQRRKPVPDLTGLESSPPERPQAVA